MQEKKAFEEKVVVITGASSGIGRATALAFAQKGAKVVLADLNEKGGQETLGMVEKAGGRGIGVKCDVSQEKDVRKLFETTLKTYDRLDCAFNNAGVEGEQANIVDGSSDNWDKVMQINVKALWLCMKQEIAIMQKQAGGAIVNCASIAGLVGFRGISAYVASKHAVIGLTKTAALECAKSNIRVNAVCPGMIHTPMLERLTHQDAKNEQKLIQGAPMGRLGKPEEIASAVLWLCSDGASFVTGHPLVVDGGWIAQ